MTILCFRSSVRTVVLTNEGLDRVKAANLRNHGRRAECFVVATLLGFDTTAVSPDEASMDLEIIDL